MTQDYPKPIAPPPELVQQWREELVHDSTKPFAQAMADRAAQWGADHELEACCVLMDDWGLDGKDLIECRRPKPQSLKEQALDAHNRMMAGEETQDDWAIVRRALEQLDE
jgi:hypothetical protein